MRAPAGYNPATPATRRSLVMSQNSIGVRGSGRGLSVAKLLLPDPIEPATCKDACDDEIGDIPWDEETGNINSPKSLAGSDPSKPVELRPAGHYQLHLGHIEPVDQTAPSNVTTAPMEQQRNDPVNSFRSTSDQTESQFLSSHDPWADQESGPDPWDQPADLDLEWDQQVSGSTQGDSQAPGIPTEHVADGTPAHDGHQYNDLQTEQNSASNFENRERYNQKIFSSETIGQENRQKHPSADETGHEQRYQEQVDGKFDHMLDNFERFNVHAQPDNEDYEQTPQGYEQEVQPHQFNSYSQHQSQGESHEQQSFWNNDQTQDASVHAQDTASRKYSLETDVPENRQSGLYINYENGEEHHEYADDFVQDEEHGQNEQHEPHEQDRQYEQYENYAKNEHYEQHEQQVQYEQHEEAVQTYHEQYDQHDQHDQHEHYEQHEQHEQNEQHEQHEHYEQHAKYAYDHQEENQYNYERHNKHGQHEQNYLPHTEYQEQSDTVIYNPLGKEYINKNLPFQEESHEGNSNVAQEEESKEALADKFANLQLLDLDDDFLLDDDLLDDEILDDDTEPEVPAVPETYGNAPAKFEANAELKKLEEKKKKNDAYDVPAGLVKPVRPVQRMKLAAQIGNESAPPSFPPASTQFSVPSNKPKAEFFGDLVGPKTAPAKRPAPVLGLQDPQDPLSYLRYCNRMTGFNHTLVPRDHKNMQNSGMQHSKGSRSIDGKPSRDAYIPNIGPYAHNMGNAPQVNDMNASLNVPVLGHRASNSFDRGHAFQKQAKVFKVDPNTIFHKQIPLFSWGTSNKVVTVIPSVSHLQQYSTSVRISKVSDLELKVNCYCDFPGPLTKSKTKKKDVEQWLQKHTEELRANGTSQDEQTLAQILLTLLRHDGAFFTAPLQRDLAAVLAPHIDFTPDNGGVINSVPSIAPNAHKLDSAGSNVVWNYIQSGNTSSALQFALSKEDYPLAIVLAQSLRQNVLMKVCSDFARKWYPVQTTHGLKAQHMMPIFLRLFVGNVKGVIEDFVNISSEGDFAIKFYKEIIAAAIVNGPTQEFLVEFGKFLCDKGMQCASEVCFIIAGILPSRTPLTNGAVFTAAGTFTLSLVYTEVYEYIMSCSPNTPPPVQANGFPHILPLKIKRAQELADLGHFTAARRYCDHIGAVLRALGKTVSISPQASADFQRLVIRLSDCSSSDSSWIGSTFSKVNLDSMWGTLDKLIGGEPSSSKPEKGVFSNFSPSLSRNTSQLDVSQIPTSAQRQDNHLLSYVGSSAANFGIPKAKAEMNAADEQKLVTLPSVPDGKVAAPKAPIKPQKNHKKLQKLPKLQKLQKFPNLSMFPALQKPQRAPKLHKRRNPLAAANLDVSFDNGAEYTEESENVAPNDPLILNTSENAPLGSNYLNPYSMDKPLRANTALDGFPIPNTPDYTSRANSVVGQAGLYSSKLSQNANYNQEYDVKDDVVPGYESLDEDEEEELPQSAKEKKPEEVPKRNLKNKKSIFKMFSGAEKQDDKPKPTKANLGNESTFVYNEELRRWIDTSRPLEEQLKEDAPPPPPMKKTQTPKPAATGPRLAPSNVSGGPDGPRPIVPAVSGGPITLEDLIQAKAPRRKARRNYVNELSKS
ncbi:hypothetical protein METBISCDRAFT_25425 [Metschnikowia bicuspidata]|uniref:Protein transport protein sec16 n=1 Tax=Metschnikowia bicuspidata TaxID=27322 RepID=A0A4P9ZIM7_9ASCO|nr:hypothetical protein METBISCDRAFT_25425 [Metschnikowia bicuspidata]